MPRRTSPHEYERTCAPGESILLEGERGREMYIIRSGRVRIFKVIDGREVTLATLGQGEFFGEMSLLEDEPRSASVQAIAQTRLLAIQPGGLLVRIRRDPTFAYEMLQRMSQRVRDVNGWLIRALENDQSLTDGTQQELDLGREAAALNAAPPEVETS